MKEKSLKSNIIWNSIGSFVYLFCQWLLTFLIVRLSDNLEDAGNLSLAISITNIFFNIACFNLRPYLVSDNTNEYSVEDYSTFRFYTIIFSFIACYIYILLFNYNTTQIICIMFYMIFKIGEAIVDLFHAFEQRKNRMDIGGISLLVRGILSTLLFIIGVKLFNNMNIAILLMIIVTFSYDKINANKFEKIKINLKNKKSINLFMKFLPLAIGTFLSSLSASLPRQILEKTSGAEVLGIYATIATPAVIVQVAASYIYNPLLVTFSDFKKDNDYKGFTKVLIKSLFVVFCLSLVCYIGSLFFSEIGLRILYGERISKYYELFSIIIIYTSLTGFMFFGHNILIILRKIKELLLIYFIGFITCLITSTYLIKTYNMNGVSYSLITFTIIIIICMFIVIIRSINDMKGRKNG